MQLKMAAKSEQSVVEVLSLELGSSDAGFASDGLARYGGKTESSTGPVKVLKGCASACSHGSSNLGGGSGSGRSSGSSGSGLSSGGDGLSLDLLGLRLGFLGLPRLLGLLGLLATLLATLLGLGGLHGDFLCDDLSLGSSGLLGSGSLSLSLEDVLLGSGLLGNSGLLDNNRLLDDGLDGLGLGGVGFGSRFDGGFRRLSGLGIGSLRDFLSRLLGSSDLLLSVGLDLGDNLGDGFARAAVLGGGSLERGGSLLLGVSDLLLVRLLFQSCSLGS